MQRARQAGRSRVVGDPAGTRNAAHVTNVGLHDIDCAPVDHLFPDDHVVVLLAAGHVDVERRGHLARPLEFPVGAGLFVVADAVILQHATDFDRLRRGVAAIRVDHQRHLVAEGLTHGPDDFLAAPGPLVDIVTAFAGDAELERVVTVRFAQREHALGLGLGVISRFMLDA